MRRSLLLLGVIAGCTDVSRDLPPGPQGPPGPAGPAGAVGKTGDTGPAGIGTHSYFAIESASVTTQGRHAWSDVPGTEVQFLMSHDALVIAHMDGWFGGSGSGTPTSPSPVGCAFGFVIDGMLQGSSTRGEGYIGSAVNPENYAELSPVSFTRAFTLKTGMHAMSLQVAKESGVADCDLQAGDTPSLRMLVTVAQ